MIDPATLPANLRRAIERKPVFAPYAKPASQAMNVVEMAYAPETTAEPTEPQTRWQRGEERKLSDALCSDLRRRGIPHIIARTDKASTIRKGWPDITALFQGKACCVELKAEGGKLSQAQKECITELEAAGVPVLVSYNLADAINFILKALIP